MDNFTNPEIESLAADAHFQQWVIHPDGQSERFWRDWAGDSPERKSLMEAARALVLAIHKGYPDQLSAEIIDMKVGKLMERVGQAELGMPSGHFEPERENIFWQSRWLRGAAAVLLLSGLIWWFVKPATPEQTIATNEKVLEKALADGITKVNNGKTDEAFVLSDSSVVTLSPGSSISFPQSFNTDRRVVTLTGNAFFEVSHNVSKPFVVYAGKTVTRVVGTSFRINTKAKSQTVTVDVRTGKVAVFPSSGFDLATLQPLKGETGILLTADQHASFNEKTRTLNKNTPPAAEIAEAEPVRELIFDDTPVSEVFKQMETEYGIDIEFDEKVYAKCPITTTFSNETLIEKINTICQAIGASYQPLDGKIIVSGYGCRH